MKIMNFFAAGIAGGITDFILGWILYGMLFHDFFGGNDPLHMKYIALGCLSFGLLMSYIYVRWANLITFTTGLKAGAGIGFFMGIMRNFFEFTMNETIDWQRFAVDVVISIVMSALVGGVVAAVNGAMVKKPA